MYIYIYIIDNLKATYIRYTQISFVPSTSIKILERLERDRTLTENLISLNTIWYHSSIQIPRSLPSIIPPSIVPSTASGC